MSQLLQRLLCGVVFMSLTALSFQAQGVMKANPDNYFITPVPSGSTGISTYLDVLLNDYYADDGTLSDMVLSVILQPTKGWVQYDASSKRLEYLPMDGTVGMDSLIYQVKSNVTNNTATATVYIKLNNQPGVISNADCFVEPDGITFDIKQIAQSDPSIKVSANTHILCGDIDYDGNIEIIAFENNPDTPYQFTAILIFSYNQVTGSLDLKYRIPYFASGWVLGQYAIAKITGENLTNPKTTASVFVTDPINAKLIRYDIVNESTQLMTETWSVTYTGNTSYSNPAPFLTDIMGDGKKQVIVADKIYDADTGILLTVATDDSNNPIVDQSNNVINAQYSFGLYGHSGISLGGAGNGANSSMMVAVDIDNDGIKELIGGGSVYKINLTDYTNTYSIASPTANTFRPYMNVDITGHPEIQTNRNGSTAVVDMDNDGLPEVVVAGRAANATNMGCIYIYNPRTGEVLHSNSINDIPRGSVYYISAAFVGDIDGDGYSEICVSGTRILKAYKYNLTAKTLDLMWDLATTDGSGCTTLSLFDFAQDKNARLVYRDEDSLRIIRSNVTEAITEYSFANQHSATISEYPIVADINGDGAAEIISVASFAKHGTGQAISNAWDTNGQVRIYAASGTAKWAPARKVWNQIAYNPVWVNDDLTIPRNPINPATKFVSSDGTVSRPFNNFLQQATMLNKEGGMVMEGADLTFSSRAPRRLTWQSDGSLTITVTVVNQGLVSWEHPISLQMYASHDGSPTTFTPVWNSYVDANASGLNPSAERRYTFTIPASFIPAEGTYDGWAITVNLDTDPGESQSEYTYGDECRSGLNNRALGFSVLDGYTIACEGATNVVVNVNPSGMYNVDWFTLGGTKVGDDTDSYTLPLKNSEEVTKLLVQAFNKNTGALITAIPDTVYVYRTADSLVWTNGANDRDWHNPGNWSKGSGVPDNYPLANVPLGCTTVTLPGGISAYPDLGDISSGGHTDYSMFPTAACEKIYFNFGSEIVRPDLLVYDSARVETQFESHRWYMYSPPLKQTYSGDFYLNNVIPSQDIIKSYTKSWGGSHPLWGIHIESSWTNIYSFPDVEYPVGYGLGVWISDNQDRDNVFFNFKFPKQDSKYHVYFTGTSNIDYGYPARPLSRNNAHRFTFDGQGASGATFSLPVEGKKVGSLVFVGNPFMSHLDFDKFYAANSTKIKPEYKVLNRNNNNYLYYIQGQSSTLNKNIAPMQGFLVEAIAPFTSLNVSGLMTLSVPGSTLRSSASEQNVQPLVVPVTVRQEDASDITYLAFGEGYNALYDSGEDVMCLFDAQGGSSMIRPVSLYSEDANGVKMNLQSLPVSLLRDGSSIPLGLRTPSQSAVTINVGNLGNIPSTLELSLYDALSGNSYALTTQSMYTFDKVSPDSDYFVKGRFYLKIGQTQTGIEYESADYGLKVYCKDGILSIKSDIRMERIDVYGLNGQQLYVSDNQGYEQEIHLSKSSVFIVRVQTATGVVTRKVINQ